MRTTVPTTPITLAQNRPRRGFVMNPAPLPAAVLADDGRHANPAALITAMSDADTRNTSTGLGYLAAHTQAGDLPGTPEPSPQPQAPAPTDQRPTFIAPACFEGDDVLPSDSPDSKVVAIGNVLLVGEERNPALRPLAQAWLDASRYHPASVQQLADGIEQNLKAAAASPTARQVAAAEELTSIVMESGDPAGAARQVLDIIDAEKHPRCTVHTWCTETSVHEWHASEPVLVVQECGTPGSFHDHDSSPYIEARLISEDDRHTGELGAGATVAFGECELTAEQLRAEVGKMLAAAPRLLALADTLDGIPPYAAPHDWDDAAAVIAPGEKGALLKAALFTPMWQGKPEGPTRLSVYSEPSSEGELDHAGALDFLARLDAFRMKVAVMVDALAQDDVQTGGAR